MGFNDKIIGMVLIGLFAIALLTFGVTFGADNPSSNTILNHSSVSGFNNSLYSEMYNVKNVSEDQFGAVSDQPPASGGDDTFSLFALPGTIWKFVTLGYDTIGLVFSSMEEVLGIPAIVINVIAGSLLIVLLIFAWRTIKAGGV